MKISKLSVLAVVALASSVTAFAPSSGISASSIQKRHNLVALNAEEGSASDSVFLAPDETAEEVDKALEKAESLGRGAAKKKRGKRKGTTAGVADKAARKSAATLAPEEVYYEGAPAITETIVPTVSILTVVGIIPAAAAWSRQAWVRYKITDRRIRVTSGIGGKDMAEIVYPDIVQIRTAKRLFGDGDLVAFLRDGAKFEMRNIPEFDEAMEFILSKVDKDVADEYRQREEVTALEKPE